LDLQDVDIAEIVEGAIESLSVAAAGKKVRLETMIDPLVGINATGDPNRLRQIVWNLLSNAIKFTPAGGKVQVVLEKVDSHVELTISDTGIGIKPEFLPHIFERYRQADATITRQYGGLGLGLAIVRNLVELHGGHISADSAGENQGATFTVSLPIRVVAKTPERQVAATKSNNSSTESRFDLTGLRVLVVDDEDDARHLIRRVLSAARCDVTCCDSAATALAETTQKTFDLIVSDIGMPTEDGYAFIRIHRQHELAQQLKRTPAIALTAYARKDDRRRALMAGFNAHLTKPVDANELLTIIASLTDRIPAS
jgi:CheY-like chemotaxis protein/two-component sensor histidine kinase